MTRPVPWEVEHDLGENKIEIITDCPECWQPVIIPGIPADAWFEYLRNPRSVFQAFPELDEFTRRMIETGKHTGCRLLL